MRAIDLYAICASRLDQGWREVHAQIHLIVDRLEQARFEEFEFFPRSANPLMLIRYGFETDIDLFVKPEYDEMIRSGIRCVYGMREPGEEDRTLLACRGWQYWGDLCPGQVWWFCMSCEKIGPWQRVYHHPRGGLDYHHPRGRPDDVHPPGLILRECSHCDSTEGGRSSQ